MKGLINMKRLLIAIILSAAIFSPVTGQAEMDTQVQIEQLQAEIAAKQAELNKLKSQMDITEELSFEHKGLSYTVSFDKLKEVEDDGSIFTPREEIYLVLNVVIENTTDNALAFDPGIFEVYLAEVEYAQTDLVGTSISRQAVPEKSAVEGSSYFDLTEAVANSKDLTVVVSTESFEQEFKVNEVLSEEAVTKEVSPVEVVAQEETSDNLDYKPGDKVETENYTGYVNPQGEPVEFSEGNQEVYDYIEDAYYNDASNFEEYTGSLPHYDGMMTPDNVDDWNY